MLRSVIGFWLLLSCLAFFGRATLAAEPVELSIELDAGNYERVNVLVRVPIKLDIAADQIKWATVDNESRFRPAQVTKPSLLANSGDSNAELHFDLPKLAANEKKTYRALLYTIAPRSSLTHFKWRNEPGQHADLLLGNPSAAGAERSVLRYMYEKLDTSSRERRDETIKPYHHVFDPETGTLITKGPGGQFTHHRGLFFGFNRITYDGDKTADVWHCRNGESQQHAEFLGEEAGPVLGRHRVKIQWRGKSDDVIAIEERELATYNMPGGTLIDFASRVETTGGPVKLDGDPQHAGFHFRAANEVSAKTKGETFYLRPDGKGRPGETRNWPAQKAHVDLPWNAMSFVVGGQRYTALYLDRPTNPKQARFSERDYGRFGSYFEYTITKDKPLEVSYRVWIQRGELTGDEAARRDQDFDEPVGVTVK